MLYQRLPREAIKVALQYDCAMTETGVLGWLTEADLHIPHP
jgi:hypothetical protein